MRLASTFRHAASRAPTSILLSRSRLDSHLASTRHFTANSSLHNEHHAALGSVAFQPWTLSFPMASQEVDLDAMAQASLMSGAFDEFTDEEEEPELELNEGFWCGYKSVPAMAAATDPKEIFSIVESFTLVRRRHSRLFQIYRHRVLADLDSWAAPELALLCRNWTELSVPTEDLLVAIAPRVVAAAQECTAQELVMLLDAYASVRCFVRSVTDVVVLRALAGPEDFSDSELCLLVSSLARLGVVDDPVLELVSARLVQSVAEVGEGDNPLDAGTVTGRDLVLAVHAFAEFGLLAKQQSLFLAFERAFAATSVLSELDPRDLKTILVALARTASADEVVAPRPSSALLDALSCQVRRRLKQLDAESLVLSLRALVFLQWRDAQLFSRVVAQLPRALLSFQPAHLVVLLRTFLEANIQSTALFDLATPYLMERSPFLAPRDALCALRAYATIGRREELLLNCLVSRLQLGYDAKRLTADERQEVVDCCAKLAYDFPLALAVVEGSVMS